ncbi:MAG: GlsB/YeaQ/YmgE family stress response membrane protein [Candidatus Saccharibacteria bacterium]|nr:GlsB/YeaQ/YmgE family stress response membrane protein [Candidatus Saccharibacteria bacterium]
MSILVWIVIGGLAGWLASIVMGKNGQMGIGANILTGVVGAFVGGWVVKLMGGDADVLTGFNLPSLATAFVGAVILLVVLRAIKK